MFLRTDIKRHLWVLWTIIKIGLYVGWPIWVAQLLAGVAIGTVGNEAAFVAVPIVIGVFAWRMFVFIRIIIALPANACDEALELKVAYERTQGLAWPLIALFFLVPASIGIRIAALQMLIFWKSLWAFQMPSFWAGLPFTLIVWAYVMFFFTLLAEVYRQLRAGG